MGKEAFERPIAPGSGPMAAMRGLRSKLTSANHPAIWNPEDEPVISSPLTNSSTRKQASRR
jgi:hypothetical protein